MIDAFQRVWRPFLPLALAVAALLLPATSQASMTVERGDVLRVLVTEAPDISREEVKVSADGVIMLPVVGSVPAAGSDLDTLRKRIEDALVDHQLIRSPTVLVEIVRYRPVYVGGAVATPGAVQFEPGMTVRHAIILAGGVDRTRGPDRVTTPELLKLKADWRANAYELFMVNTSIARLRAELERGAPPDFDAVDKGFLDPDDSRDVVALDSAVFDNRMDQWSKQQAHLNDVLSLFDLEIDVLTRQAELQTNEQALQKDQVERSQELVDKGLMPMSRLQELQREASRLSRDLLESQAYMARARQGKETQRYAEDVADADWQIKVRGELREAMQARNKLESNTEVLAAALLDAGISLTDDRAALAADPEVRIHRDGAGGASLVDAPLSTELVPGDVLEVEIRRAPGLQG